MLVKIIESWNNDGECHEVRIDGMKKATIGPLWFCPEDAIIGRDLIDGIDISKFIQMGYDAAKRGEELIIEIKHENT